MTAMFAHAHARVALAVSAVRVNRLVSLAALDAAAVFRIRGGGRPEVGPSAGAVAGAS